MPDVFGGHERREERRARRHGRRYVRDGEEFTSDELDRGDVDLQEHDPSGPEPFDGYEPWARDGTKDETERDRERLRAYREFIESRREEDPDYGDDS